MPFTESLVPFFADFGEGVTVQGASVTGIFNAATMMELGEVLGSDITLEVPATVTAAEGGAVVVRGTNYVIRQVLDQPPDGALRTLVLARA
jgi:hypothetical protein